MIIPSLYLCKNNHAPPLMDLILCTRLISDERMSEARWQPGMLTMLHFVPLSNPLMSEQQRGTTGK